MSEAVKQRDEPISWRINRERHSGHKQWPEKLTTVLICAAAMMGVVIGTWTLMESMMVTVHKEMEGAVVRAINEDRIGRAEVTLEIRDAMAQTNVAIQHMAGQIVASIEIQTDRLSEDISTLNSGLYALDNNLRNVQIQQGTLFSQFQEHLRVNAHAGVMLPTILPTAE